MRTSGFLCGNFNSEEEIRVRLQAKERTIIFLLRWAFMFLSTTCCGGKCDVVPFSPLPKTNYTFEPCESMISQRRKERAFSASCTHRL